MSDIEKKSLEAHVELCAERYETLNARLLAIDTHLAALNAALTANVSGQYKTYLGWAGVIIITLVGLVVHFATR